MNQAEVYQKPAIVRFGTLAEITHAKPALGADLASPYIPQDCNMNAASHSAAACRS